MLRFILYLLATVLVVTVLRSVIGIVLKAASGFLGGPSQPAKRHTQPAGGVLHKDPVCGAYVPDSISVKLPADGQILHFCSDDCKKKYQSGKV